MAYLGTRKTLFFDGLKLFCCLFGCCPLLTINGKRPPNIVLIIADDLGIGDIGCFGNTSIKTPHIDQIAADGAILTHHVTAAAVCTPSRAAFLTGRYPIRSGMAPHGTIQVNLLLSAVNGLPAEEITVGELVKTSSLANYTTGFIGKWHLGLHGSYTEDYEHHPRRQGFDYFYGIMATIVKDFDDKEQRAVRSRFPNFDIVCSGVILGGFILLSAMKKNLLLNSCLYFTLLFLIVFITSLVWWICLNLKLLCSVIMRNYEVVEQPINLSSLTDRLVNEGKSFLQMRKDGNQPFLLIMSWAQVHTALHGTKFKGQSTHGRYGDEVMEMDWSVGEITAELARLGFTDNTFLYFTSDHGGHLEETGVDGEREGGSNNPYSGGKFQGGMEGGIRVPTVAMWPGHIPPGSTVDVPTSQMDIFSTVASLTSATQVKDRIIDGKDLVPLLTRTEEKSPHEYMFHYCNREIHAVRYMPNDGTGNVWKLHLAQPDWINGTDHCDFMCECNDAKQLDPPLLYNIALDPPEKKPCRSDNDVCLGGDKRDYGKIVKKITQATHDHTNSIKPVVSQFSVYRMLPIPWLQPCCNFPYCYCQDN